MPEKPVILILHRDEEEPEGNNTGFLGDRVIREKLGKLIDEAGTEDAMALKRIEELWNFHVSV